MSIAYNEFPTAAEGNFKQCPVCGEKMFVIAATSTDAKQDGAGSTTGHYECRSCGYQDVTSKMSWDFIANTPDQDN